MRKVKKAYKKQPEHVALKKIRDAKKNGAFFSEESNGLHLSTNYKKARAVTPPHTKAALACSPNSYHNQGSSNRKCAMLYNQSTKHCLIVLGRFAALGRGCE